jgi:hypothetical protein
MSPGQIAYVEARRLAKMGVLEQLRKKGIKWRLMSNREILRGSTEPAAS